MPFEMKRIETKLKQTESNQTNSVVHFNYRIYRYGVDNRECLIQSIEYFSLNEIRTGIDEQILSESHTL